ncbi:MAG: monofunctional biosynthetic peptidoglycan transglycosylase [Pseudomonadales bacterium]
MRSSLKKRSPWKRRLLRMLLWLLASCTLATLVPVLLLRWLNPPTSMVMLLDRLHAPEGAPPLRYTWTPWSTIGANARLAFVSAEDQRFPSHFGFDLVELRAAISDGDGSRRGASTITQQTAKNLFLWTGRSWLRKGLEAWFTVLIECSWSKRRILEVYLNIAQTGPRLYGIAAASEHYFGRAPSALSDRQAALVAAALPNPVLYRISDPSPALLQRQQWVLMQMRQLGGTAWLRQLE